MSGARARAEAGDVLFGNIDTFLIWNLTGGLHVTDCTNASRTQLMNLETLDWDEELLAAFGIPRAMLPRIRVEQRSLRRAPHGVASKGVPIAGILGDQQAALVGQTCFHAGRGEEHLRHRLFPADEHRHEAGALAARHADHGGVPARRASRRATRWKAASRSPARWCSGCATTSG